jgi:hypothetical protein
VVLAFNLNDILLKRIERKTTESPDASRSIWRTIRRVRRNLDTTFRSHSHLYFIVRERLKIALRKAQIVSPTMVPLPAFDIGSAYGISAWHDTRKALLDIAAELKKDDVKFLLAILPVEMQLSSDIADMYRREYGFVFADSLLQGKPQELIKDFAHEHGIAYVDLLPPFRKEPHEKKFFRIYGGSVDWNHPNPIGHRIIAEELVKGLKSLTQQVL